MWPTSHAPVRGDHLQVRAVRCRSGALVFEPLGIVPPHAINSARPPSEQLLADREVRVRQAATTPYSTTAGSACRDACATQRSRKQKPGSGRRGADAAASRRSGPPNSMTRPFSSIRDVVRSPYRCASSVTVRFVVIHVGKPRAYRSRSIATNVLDVRDHARLRSRPGATAAPRTQRRQRCIAAPDSRSASRNASPGGRRKSAYDCASVHQEPSRPIDASSCRSDRCRISVVFAGPDPANEQQRRKAGTIGLRTVRRPAFHWSRSMLLGYPRSRPAEPANRPAAVGHQRPPRRFNAASISAGSRSVEKCREPVDPFRVATICAAREPVGVVGRRSFPGPTSGLAIPAQALALL